MKVKNLLNKASIEEKEQNTPEFCLPRTYIGLEYEWEGTENFPFNNDHPLSLFNPQTEIANAVKKYFNWHVDGSLRNNGMEFTCKEPYSGTRLLNAIEAMDDAARSFAFTSSYRTSLHVHLDLSEMNYPEDSYHLAGLYSLVEPLMYKFVGNNRDSCNYCIPWYANPYHYQVYLKTIKPFLYKEKAEIALSARSIGEVLKGGKAHHKYAGMNLFSLGEFGTAEFRQAPVNMQRAKILLWINCLMRLKQSVIENQWSPDNLFHILKKYGEKYFTERVFKEQAPYLLKCTRDLREDYRTGSLTLYHFLSLIEAK